EAIGANSAIRDLVLVGAPDSPIPNLSRTILESLDLGGGGAVEFGDTATIPPLRKIFLTNLKKLERFTGDNGNLTWMVIQKCPKFDSASIATAPNLESLNVVAIKNQIRLGDFARLARLRSLSLQRCHVEIDTTDVQSTARILEELLIEDVP